MSLAAAALFAFTASAIYAYVGHRLANRTTSPAAKLAAILFALWWFALAASSAISGLENLLAAVGVRDMDLFVTLGFANALAVCVALWGLLYYLVFLFTGSRRLLYPLSAFYIAYYVILVYYLVQADPIDLNLDRWDVSIEYTRPEGPLFLAVLVLLIAPQFLAALAYLLFLREVRDRSQRYRVAVVSISIMVWFGSAFLGAILNLSENEDWQLVSRLIGVAAAVAILWAYHPPRFLQRRLRVQPITAEGSP